MKKCPLPLCVLAVLSCAAAADAQDRGQTGLTFAFPASVGLIFHPSDRVAIRPDFSFSTSVSETSLVDESESESRLVGVGVSAMVYVRRWDNLRAYVTPIVQYSRASVSSPSLSESRTSAYSVTGAFGAQYSLSRRFGVFAETGIGYRHQTTTTTLRVDFPVTVPGFRTETHAHGWSTRGGVGAIFYF